MTTQKLVLWGAGTMRTHRTLWLAEELGLDYEHRPIGPRTGETKTDEFLAINPRHKVPAMVHGDVCLTESAAIMTYMTETFPVPDRFYVPGDTLGRARLLEWCFFAMSELDANAIYNIRRHGDLVQEYGASPIAVRAAIEYFDHQLERMKERIVEAGEFLMGEKISIADILFMSCLDAGQRYELALPEFLRDYRIRMRSRPAYAETYPRNYGGRAAPEV
ncbi:MAG: glutathione S-transferase family protein [Defluviicoccus sp.]|nr:glutathione S-transferase family protein [Defluviicoccus sp.]MDE0279047.1 glutathione S-transferase family protein [Defluviicoccus sp.]